MDATLLRTFVERVTGGPLEQQQPRRLSPQDVLKLMWPLNDFFRPIKRELDKVPYEARFEPHADQAIEALAVGSELQAWTTLEVRVLRVLMERHTQFLVVVQSNELQNQPVMMTVPAGLADPALRVFAMLWGWHQMKLLLPPQGAARPGTH